MVVTVLLDEEELLGTATFTYRAPTFIRGDVNADGFLDPADVTTLITYLTTGVRDSLPVLDAADSNDDGTVDFADLPRLTDALFKGADLPLPYPAPGVDPTEDELAPCNPP